MDNIFIDVIRFADGDWDMSMQKFTPRVDAVRAPRKEEIEAFNMDDDEVDPETTADAVGIPEGCVDCGECRADCMPLWTMDDPCGCFV